MLLVTAGTVVDGDILKKPNRTYVDREEISSAKPFATNSWIKVHGKEQLLSRSSNTQNVVSSGNMLKGSIPLKLIPPIGHNSVQPHISLLDPRINRSKDIRFGEGGQSIASKTSEYTFEVDDLNIPWSDLVLKERIGAG